MTRGRASSRGQRRRLLGPAATAGGLGRDLEDHAGPGYGEHARLGASPGGYPGRMSRSSVLLAALTDEPVSTSELYDRVGYVALARAGLIPYPAFRSELEALVTAGLAISTTGGDGATLWRTAPSPRPGPTQAPGVTLYELSRWTSTFVPSDFVTVVS